ncbi:MAG: CDP-glucose 4,6-dehydratase [Burkholderiales bacterium]|nr:CDP-glucose 4,6-dehydratase [Burkholderiales bacterium]
MINSQFWQGKKVLLTGCTGFKGSWMTIWLNMLGAKVFGYSLAAPTNPSMWEDMQLDSLCAEMCYADIRDYARLESYLQQVQPEIIIHMAAQPLVRYSYQHPRETYEVNVMGTVNLLDAVRNTGYGRAVVNVTTDKCYENKEWLWAYRENEPMGGHDPYSNSKGCSELVTSAFINSYFGHSDSQTFVASGRAGNVIGGGDWAEDRLIPDIIRSFSQQQAVNVRNPNSVRPWQHVLEPLSGYLLLAEKLYTAGQKYSGGWNFGPLESDTKTVGEIVAQMCQTWGDNATWTHDQQEHPHEANLLRLDCSKARMLLNWQPVWNSQITLTKLTLWYKAYFAKQDMLALSKQQINDYMKDTQC